MNDNGSLLLGRDGLPITDRPLVQPVGEQLPAPDPKLMEVLKAVALFTDLHVRETPDGAFFEGWVPAAVYLSIKHGSQQAAIKRQLPFVNFPVPLQQPSA